MSIGARLRSERQRLGLSQSALAAVAGVPKSAQISWEKDVSSPTALALAAMSEAGVDTLFVVTGIRRDAPLGDWEAHHSVDSIEKKLADPTSVAAADGIGVDRMLEVAKEVLRDIATSTRSDVTEPTRKKADNLLVRHFNDDEAAKRHSARYASLMVRRQHAGRDLGSVLR